MRELRTALQTDLAMELAQVLPSENPELAEELLGRDSRAHLFVGVRMGEPVAYFYDWPLRQLSTTPVSAEMLNEPEDYDLLGEDALPSVEQWVAEQGREEWRWLHPRFQWVFDREERR